MSDFTEWAKEQLDIKLSPYQERLAEALLRGEVVMHSRMSGRSMVMDALKRYGAWDKS